MNYDAIEHQQVVSLMKEAFAKVNPQSLAYLYATGKSELYARDLLSSYLNSSPDLPQNYFVGREWKRHDMTINNGPKPVLIVEGKSNTHYDAADIGRLLKNKVNMRKSAKDDLEKSGETLKALYGRKDAVPIVLTNLLFGIDLNPANPVSQISRSPTSRVCGSLGSSSDSLEAQATLSASEEVSA